MESLELLYDYIEFPEKAETSIAQKLPLGLALAGFGVGSLGLALWKNGAEPGILSFILVAAFFVLWNAATSFLLAATIHLFISLGGRVAGADSDGRAGTLFAYFGLADFSWALAVPLAIFLRLGAWAYWPAVVSVSALGFFNLFLKMRGVRSVYGLSSTRAWAMLIFPYILAAVLAGCLFLLAAGSFFLS